MGSAPKDQRSLGQKALRILVEKLDLTFSLGRFFGLVPVMILSRQITDAAQLAPMVAAYQMALFLSTIVIYGGAQVYLVKQGVERRVFLFHMALSSLLMGAVLLGLDWVGMTALAAPFAFLVLFRSYYLLLASYLKFHPAQSLFLILMALASLAVFALTLNYWAAAALAGLMVLAFVQRQGMLKLRYARIALRQYLRILRRNSGYFITFLLQQTFTQITLAAYALVAGGVDYLRATHTVYLFALSFIAHAILFRLTLAKMSQSAKAKDRQRHLRLSQQIGLGLGLLAALALYFGHIPLEVALFGQSRLDQTGAALLAAMVLLNSVNVGWSALFLSLRQPYLLASLQLVSLVIVLVGIFALSALGWSYPLETAMIAGLAGQTLLRTIVGRRTTRNMLLK